VAVKTNTVAGYILNMAFNQYQSSTNFAYIQSFISGSLLHVVFHKPHDDGCMHTSAAHDHTHHQQSHLQPEEQNQGVVDYLSHKLPNKWESLGMLLGAITLLLLNVIY